MAERVLVRAHSRKLLKKKHFRQLVLLFTSIFNPKKHNFPLFSDENELAHDNKRVSNYNIMQKSQIRKFRFSGTLRYPRSPEIMIYFRQRCSALQN